LLLAEEFRVLEHFALAGAAEDVLPCLRLDVGELVWGNADDLAVLFV
jgi:hypothetical protein